MTDNLEVTADVTAPAEATATPQLSEREQFLSSLPDEYKQDPTFARFNNWNDVAKSYHHASKMVGMDKSQIVALPKDDSPEGWDPIFISIGRPDAPEGYGYDKYKEAIPPEELGEYAKLAHQAGMGSKQFDAIVGKFVEQTNQFKQQQAEQMQQQVSEWQETVKKEYGAAYDEKIAYAQKAVEKFGLSDVIKGNPEIFENPAIIKAFVEIGEKTSEGIVLANGDVSHGKLAPNEAIMELAKMQSDSAIVKILTDKQHPQHKFMLQKREQLFKYAYPE